MFCKIFLNLIQQIVLTFYLFYCLIFLIFLKSSFKMDFEIKKIEINFYQEQTDN